MRGKRIVVGVTGGIAAYKAAELVRLLSGAGARVRVAMTESAARFVSPLTFAALSGDRVACDMYAPEADSMDHITWGQEADLIVIAPATADFIARAARGMGDDFLSTMLLAATAKTLFCPSMNSRMFLNPALQENLGVLRRRGHAVMDPAEGALACGTEGPGRLPEPALILEEARYLVAPKDLAERRLLVTAGATREQIDPVRYLTNRSSGKMGFALARAASLRGAEVVLVSGPTCLSAPARVSLQSVTTTEDMRQAVLQYRRDADAVIMAAAVLDYRPLKPAPQKVKKGSGTATLELVETSDILCELGRSRQEFSHRLVGFAAETENLLAHARQKLTGKNLDLLVANDVSREDAGFESDTNAVRILHRDGRVEELPLMPKEELANHLLDRVKDLWNPRT